MLRAKQKNWKLYKMSNVGGQCKIILQRMYILRDL